MSKKALDRTAQRNFTLGMKNFIKSDWFTCIATTLAMAATVVFNYLYHGGRVVW